VKKKAIGFGMQRGSLEDGMAVQVNAVVTEEVWQGVSSAVLQLKKITAA
jgi:hypothetical protein